MTAHLLPLLREIGDLKRVTSAGRPGSIAERAFRQAWSELLRGRGPLEVALGTSAACLAATRLGDLDQDVLGPLGLSSAEVATVQVAALEELRALVGEALLGRLIGRPLPPGPRRSRRGRP